MRCGAKCFLVEVEGNGKREKKSVTARTPAEARKAARLEYGSEVTIVKVVEEKKK